MTGPEWESCGDPDRMLGYLGRCRRRRTSGRKRLLFACACCRAVARTIPDEWATDVVAVAEGLADGLADPSVVAAVMHAANEAHAWTGGIITPAEHAVFALARPDVGRRFGYQDARRVASHAAAAVGWERVPHPADAADRRARKAAGQRRVRAIKAASREVCGLLREVVGNPFRLVGLKPSRRTATVRDLSEAIYAERAFDRLPILADALEEAGCQANALLSHLRGPVPHVRGCWALDAILGLS